MQVRETRKLAKTLGAAVAVALLAVPVAQARLDPGPAGAVVRTDARHAALAQGTGARVVIVKPIAESKIAQMHRHLTQLNLPAGKTAGVVSSSSFDWGDAGIGAGVGLGLVLIAGGGVLVTRRKLVNA
jgi:hypothetical protein